MRYMIFPAFIFGLVSSNLCFNHDLAAVTEDSYCQVYRAKLDWSEAALKDANGKLVDVQVDSSCRTQGKILQFKISTDEGDVLVNLGPEAYLNPSRFRFSIGDSIKVRGALFEGEQQKVLLASEVVIGSKKTILRDKNGHPVWLGHLKQINKAKTAPETSH
ncbi:MAG: hypothetical protein NTX25_04385 [Proteobacteria bacterium]|nr:hypothetical protein [Pseudomonadota bacterium]